MDRAELNEKQARTCEKLNEKQARTCEKLNDEQARTCEKIKENAWQVKKNVITVDGKVKESESLIVREYELSVKVGKKETYSIICTNDRLKELVIGRLVADGMIKEKEEITDITISETDGFKGLAEIQLKNTKGDFKDKTYSKAESSFKAKPEWIFNLAKKFSEGMLLHSLTQGAHSCILARKDEILFSCEDISRHNTIDKAVGYAILNGINLSECMVYTSGRVPSDMVLKAVNAGIPIIVSKAVPTFDACEMAKKHGVTLICKAYPDKYEIY